MYSASKRVEFLDSIRGLAALFVLFSHTCGAFVWPPSYFKICGLPFISILFDGKEAVCMFFVLSGYVLSKPYVSTPENRSPRKIFLPTFYLRRLTRIWLPWFFVFVASILARQYLFTQPSTQPPVSGWLHQFWQAAPGIGDCLRQCVFALHDGTRQLLNQDWSLGVELKGSLLIPLFLLLTHHKRIAAISALAVVLLICFRNGHYYVSFIIGVLLAQHGAIAAGWLAVLGTKARVIFSILGLSLYQAFHLFTQMFPETPWVLVKCGWTITSLGCALVLLSVFSSQRSQKFLNFKPVVFLGKISYSVYLVQFIIILCLLPPLVRLANAHGIIQPFTLFLLTFTASVGATLLCATFTCYVAEVPAINFGHWLTKKIQTVFKVRT
ncbi:MAG: acyltransferase [Verrucomicrobia bacterium]|nr:acyltransferase [Verrucomicrobiota bacterium]